LPARQPHAHMHHMDPLRGDHVCRVSEANHYFLGYLPPLDDWLRRVTGHLQLCRAPRDEAVTIPVPIRPHREAILPVLLPRRILFVTNSRSVKRGNWIPQALLSATKSAADVPHVHLD